MTARSVCGTALSQPLSRTDMAISPLTGLTSTRPRAQQGQSSVVGAAVAPTIPAMSLTPPSDPANAASPNVKTPPSPATSQYPDPVGVGTRPTTEAACGPSVSEPNPLALPEADT